MAERRSINEALNLTPDKIAFIRQDPRLQPVNGQGNQSVDPDESVNVKTSRKMTQASLDSAVTVAASRNQTRRTTTQPTLSAAALVPLTTRLQPETADALRRAYLERKLDGFANATQQEIVEEALQIWLIQEGYLANEK